MDRLLRFLKEIRRRTVWQVLGVYIVASWGVLSGVGTLSGILGLPDWFPSLALGLLLVGLPIVLATALVQEKGVSETPTLDPVAKSEATPKAATVLTWSRVGGGGVLAFALWGVIALAWGAVQVILMSDGVLSPQRFVLQWTGVAVIASGLMGVEAVRRARALHGPHADRLTLAMARGLVPAALAGAMMTAVLFLTAPQVLWLLPGLWQILLGVALFALAGSLPAGMRLVAGWYLMTGLACLALNSGDATPSPGSMALPFGLGQFLAAAIHYRAGRDHG